MQRISIIALFATFVWGSALGAPSFETGPTSFGFAGIEFYKLNWGTHNLRVGDINGDGLNDIVVANNAKARIECLLQRKEPKADEARISLEPNELPDDKRFESRPFLAEKKIFSLALGDINGDGRTDMAYYGDPMELVVVYQDMKGEWGARRRLDIKDGSRHTLGLCISDLNGDARNDIALMATDGTYFLFQDSKGVLDAPVKDAGLPEGAFGLYAADLNGDQRTDLMYVGSDETRPLSFRFQDKDGRMGPENRCEAVALRSVRVGNAESIGVAQPVGIHMRSGRLVAYRLTSEAPTGELLDGAFDRYRLHSSGARRPRAIAVGMFSGGELADILVTHPEAAEVELFVQPRPGLWNRKGSFPSLQTISSVGTLDPQGEIRSQAVLLSPDEPMLGIAHVEETGRMTFPHALPTVGKPTAMVVGDIFNDKKPEITYVSTSERSRVVHVLEYDEQREFSEILSIEVQNARSDPDGLLLMDINQDGFNDILVFTPYQEMRVLKQSPAGHFIDVSGGSDYGKSLVTGARAQATAVADIDGDGKPELILAAKNLARALKLDEKDRLVIVEQFNGYATNSDIVAVGAADLDGDGIMEIVLADAPNNYLSALKRNAMNVYEIVENFKISPMTISALKVADLTGDGKPEVLLLGQNEFCVLRPGIASVALRESTFYETPIRNGWLAEFAIGDLNADGKPDILASETTKDILEILVLQESGKPLQRALNWPVFERKSFGYDRHGENSNEPREFLIADVTGDNRDDAVFLIHDRIMVYPQEQP